LVKFEAEIHSGEGGTGSGTEAEISKTRTPILRYLFFFCPNDMRHSRQRQMPWIYSRDAVRVRYATKIYLLHRISKYMRPVRLLIYLTPNKPK